MIKFDKISKVYGDVTANDSISFHCEKGEIHGLLGVNGAGKSTALKVLAGLIKPDAGIMTIDGIDVQKQRTQAQKRMGLFLSTEGLYPKLTARENIELFASFHGLKDVKAATAKIIDELHLQGIAARQVEGFSTGQKMKVALARALVHQPDYVILDEPTRGLDVMSIRLLREYLLSLKAKGCCVLFSSHVMQEIDMLCDRVTVIDQGKVCFDGDLDGLRNESAQQDLEQAFVKVVGVA